MAPLLKNVPVFGVCFMGAVMFCHSNRYEGDFAATATRFKVARVAWPAELNDKFKKPQHLGTGSFGESWLAEGLAGTDYAQRKVVVKLLYVNYNSNYFYLTKNFVDGVRKGCGLGEKTCKKTAAKLQKKIDEAVEECEIAMNLQKFALMTHANKKYAQRLMGCYGHNYWEKRRDEPIYVVLENCGVQSLDGYIKTHRADFKASQMASITRQILEGLEFLSKMKPWPVVHHDLKPDNIVVKELQGGKVSVHLIDFGGMMYADPDDIDDSTISTTNYAPKEWKDDADVFHVPATSFDIYSVGNILAEMATGKTFNDMFSVGGKNPNFTAIDQQIASEKSRTRFVQLLRDHADMSYKGVDAIDKDAEPGGARDFTVDGWARTVCTDPAKRPTPGALLALPWLQNADSPDDPDWTMISPSVLVDELPVYWPGDLVKVWSRSNNSWFSDGKVLEVFDDGRVSVQYDFQGDDDYAYKTLDAVDVPRDLEKIQTTFSVGDEVWVWSNLKQDWYTDGKVIGVTENHVKVKYNEDQLRANKRKSYATENFRKVPKM